MTLSRLFVTGILIGLCSVAGIAQISSNGTGGGAWSSAATWQGGTVPTGSETITIQSTDSINFDVPVTITGTIKSLSGRLRVFDSSKVVFGNNGVYEHAANGGTLPKATWNEGSTCLITGAVGNAPSNGNQNFYNLTWDCPDQSTGLNLGMHENIIGGNIRVVRSNGLGFRLTASGATAVKKLITINGNAIVDSSTGYLTATGSSGLDTITVILKGDIISRGIFQLANGSGAKCNWLVSGNISALGGTFTTNSGTANPDSLIFEGGKKLTLIKAGEIGAMSNIRFYVRSGTTLDIDTNQLGASENSTFALEAGATLISAHPDGVNGNLNNGASPDLSTEANFVFDGDTAQVTGSFMPATVNNLTINNSKGVKLSQATTINGVLALKAGVFDNTIPFTLGAGGSVSLEGGSLLVTSVKLPEGTVPRSFFVNQNYPNPFNPSTTITYGLPDEEFVTAAVYNMLGQKVATLFEGRQDAGVHNLQFNAHNLTSGIYFYRIHAGNLQIVKQMVLLK